MINVNDFDWNKIEKGAEKYDFIMKRFLSVDVSKDIEFQTRFTGFYRVRRNKETFLKKYYTYMESLKGKTPTYDEIIRHIHTFLGTIERSFSSKLLATLNPNMPVWDQYVLSNANIKAPNYYSVTIEKCVGTYRQIVEYYTKLLQSADGQEMLELFDEKLPQFDHFTSVKKIDLMLWQKR